jgi:hypothetical protein
VLSSLKTVIMVAISSVGYGSIQSPSSAFATVFGV